MDSKFHAYVCIDPNSRCVSIAIFDGSGKNIEEKAYCNTEVIELIGTTRIMVNDHLIGKLFCVNLEMEKSKIEQRSTLIKIG